MKLTNEDRIVAQWFQVDRRGNRQYILTHNEFGYSYRGPQCGGFLGSVHLNDKAAIEHVQSRVDCEPVKMKRGR